MLGAAIAAGAGQLLTGLINYKSQQNTNESNEAIARGTNEQSARNAEAQMRFQEAMSNTAYQRAMADMKQAGLNPILAYSQGGASAPQGAAAPVTSAKLDAPQLGGVSEAMNSALSMYRIKNEVDQAKADVALKQMQQVTQASQAELNISNAKKAAVDAEHGRAKVESERIHQMGERSFQKNRKMTEDLNRDWIRFDNTRRRIDETIGTTGKAIDTFNPLKWIRNFFGKNSPPPPESKWKPSRDGYIPKPVPPGRARN